jgi:LEA14-like dessication related protein
MKIERKYIVAGGLAVISVFLAYGYLQYKKLMEYCLSFKGVKIKGVSAQSIDFDLFLNFTNKSDHDLVIKNQEYKVYLNDKPLAVIRNSATTTLKAKSKTPLGINIKVDDVAGKINSSDWLGLLSKGLNNELVVDIKMNVKYMILSLPVTYKYRAKLSELAKPSEGGQTDCK